MSNRVIYALIAVALAIFWCGFLALIVAFSSAVSSNRVYDCSIAEFHPDITPKEREKCRQLRSTKL